MQIAVDIMGGDYAPEEIVQGTLAAAKAHPRRRYILVGLAEALNALPPLPDNVTTHTAGSVMGMDEAVENLTKKRDSSIWLATKLVKEGQAQAVISAGSTGAQMVAAHLLFGRIKGINRPAIVGIIPTPQGQKLFVDMGANTACTPEMLLQFAIMGHVYARQIMGIESPRIALLSNGSEKHKGSETVIEAHKLLENAQLNFIGNLEGRDITAGHYDVMVTDGFTGNVALKTIEGTASGLFSLIKGELGKNLLRKIGAALILPGLREIKKMLDPNEQGGAPLVGVQGISIICHGSSNRQAIVSALDVAAHCIEGDFLGKIAQALAERQSPPVQQDEARGGA